MMKRLIQILVGLLFWVLMASAAWADDSKMTHMVFRFMDSQAPKGGELALAPRKVWRIGFKYMRIEEPPDAEKGIHGLLIVDEPDVFMINRYNKQGQHILDPGPVFEVHMPIFDFPRNSEISKLEFGGEWEFFSKRKARKMPNVKKGDKRYKAYMLKIEGAKLILLLDEATGHPAQLSLQSEKGDYLVRYETYESGLEPDMNLFKVPAGVKIYEAKK